MTKKFCDHCEKPMSQPMILIAVGPADDRPREFCSWACAAAFAMAERNRIPGTPESGR